MQITLDREKFELTREIIVASLAGQVPEDIRQYWVNIDGTRWPVKQVIALATGADRNRFQSQSSRRWLRKLDFTMGGDGPPPAESGSDLLQALVDAAAVTRPDRSPEEREELRLALREAQAALGDLLPDNASTWGEGAGNPAFVPWVSIHPKGDAGPDPKSGYYLVYLIAHDGSSVNLSLGVGTTVAKKKPAIRARSAALRAAHRVPQQAQPKPRLEPMSNLVENYIEGTAYSIPYDVVASLPSSEVFESDLKELVGILDAIWDSGLRFHNDGEPIHIFYPWIEDKASGGIVTQRKAIADELGSSWWVSGRPVAAEKVTEFATQISSGIPTYAYLYAAGDSWRARLVEITSDASRVLRNPELLADGYPPEPNHLSMRLTDFQPMPTEWRGEGLFLSTDGRPVEQSVDRRPAFSYVVSGRPEDHMSVETVPEPTSIATGSSSNASSELQELASRSGLQVSLLHDMYGVLSSNLPQLVLSGPPGTGKTWLAKELAAIGNVREYPFSVVQFHPSYAYEDFIEGLRPAVEDKQVVFRTTPGHLLEIVRTLPDGGPNTLIIDELNRANIPSVFGELLYLLEYRAESIRLRMSGDFSLPADLRFIATMNAADRSVRSMDAALRRRFEIFELEPSRDALANYFATQARLDIPDLLNGFETLNSRLSEAIDRHHGIGHSFFMANHMTSKKLRAVWDRKVLPIIEEYFFDEPERVESDFSFYDLWPSQSL